MRIALCHEWLTAYGGSDQVAAEIARSFGIEDVFTFALEPSLARELFPQGEVKVAHKIGRSSLAQKHWGWFLPVMPFAWKRLDLSGFDLVITSSHSCVNAIRVPDGTPVISYCHTPMRYAWEWEQELARFPRPARPIWPAIAAMLRAADRRWAARVTTFIANSRNVAERIGTYYGRSAEVVYPPIDLDYWTPDAAVPREDFFLYAGRLVPYKRPDVAVQAATRAGVPLIVAGAGPEYARLRSIAGPTVEFVHRPTRDALKDLYRRTQALVFPGIEDFGMTIVEAQACGAPVIARAAGGALESVQDGVTGTLYREPSSDGLAKNLLSFDPTAFSDDAATSNARRFSSQVFSESLHAIVDGVETPARRSPTREQKDASVLHLYLEEPGGGAAYAEQLADALEGTVRVALSSTDARELKFSAAGWARAVRRTVRAVKENDADLIHAHGVRAAALALLAARRTGRPVVCTVHGLHSLRRSPTKPVVAMNKVVLSRMRLVFALTESDAAEIAGRGWQPRASIRVTPPLFRFPNVAGPTGDLPPPVLPADAFVALWIGRLSEQKDPEAMIEIIEHSEASIHGLIVGDGPMANVVAAAVASSPARERIHLREWLSPPDAAYARADVFVSTSRWEGLPLTGLEAAAAGLPLLLTRAPGNVDLAALVPGSKLFDDAAEAARLLDALQSQSTEEREAQRISRMDSVRAELHPSRAIEEVLAGYRSIGVLK